MYTVAALDIRSIMIRTPLRGRTLRQMRLHYNYAVAEFYCIHHQPKNSCRVAANACCTNKHSLYASLMQKYACIHNSTTAAALHACLD